MLHSAGNRKCRFHLKKTFSTATGNINFSLEGILIWISPSMIKPIAYWLGILIHYPSDGPKEWLVGPWEGVFSNHNIHQAGVGKLLHIQKGSNHWLYRGEKRQPYFLGRHDVILCLLSSSLISILMSKYSLLTLLEGFVNNYHQPWTTQ